MSVTKTALIVTLYLIGFIAFMCVSGLVFGKVEELFTPKKKGEKKMTDIRDFEIALVSAIKRTGHTVRVEEHTMQGDTKVRRVIIDPKENGVCPAVRLNDMHELYLQGMTIDSIVENILSLEKPPLDIIRDESIYTHLCYRLLNVDNNRELLKDTPHKTICNDLALCLQAVVAENDDGCYVTLINDTVFEYKMWGIAETNAPTILPAKLTTMMGDVFGYGDNMLITGITEDEDMYVLKTENGLFGAAALFYDGVKERIHELLGDFYALPSSVHEWLIVPVTDGTNDEIAHYRAIIAEANDKVVDHADVLSYNPYVYDGTELKIA